ncbi:LON peptidase substrate-binding domain-containing protein [Robertkochia flava]|uniref:LON peptidase substrate-binding domain-containing protein n=1 Tax=Robertkochia flava TaxID=3447986 RepID=UPI001CCEC8F5|nr:LON peptidase substrate-binding domain-containing protein [Robertkochia marina]
MNDILPLFPLQIVVFPEDRLPLHVFEDRYRELVRDCRDGKGTFGIPTYIDGGLGFGSEVTIDSVVKEYDTGKFDIICEATRAFRILEFHNPQPGKLYSGGVVEYLDNIEDGQDSQRQRVVRLIRTLYKEIGVSYKVVPASRFRSFQYAHKVGFNLKEEYQMLQMTSEAERLLYLETHLERILPIIRQVNSTKKLIGMNGHFRNYDPLDFKDFKLH